MKSEKSREFRAYTAPGVELAVIMVVIFHKTVVLFSNGKKKNMLTDTLYSCVQSISIFEQSQSVSLSDGSFSSNNI